MLISCPTCVYRTGNGQWSTLHLNDAIQLALVNSNTNTECTTKVNEINLFNTKCIRFVRAHRAAYGFDEDVVYTPILTKLK